MVDFENKSDEYVNGFRDCLVQIKDVSDALEDGSGTVPSLEFGRNVGRRMGILVSVINREITKRIKRSNYE